MQRPVASPATGRCPSSPVAAFSGRSHAVATQHYSFAARTPALPCQLRRASRSYISAASSSTQATVEVEIPGSQQEAVDQAVESLRPLLQPLLRTGKRKGFDRSRLQANRLAVEIPVADTSPAAQAALAAAILAGLGPDAPGRAIAVFADERVAALNVPGSRAVLGLRAACRQKSLAGPLLLVGPKVEDVLLVSQLLNDVWTGQYVVALNSEWASGVPAQYAAIPESFEFAFSFQPMAIQGLLGKKEGAVLRRVVKGNLADSPWLILLQGRGGNFNQVGQTKVRPSPPDLELAFMNAAAASSPLTGAAKLFKSVKDGLAAGIGGGNKA